MRNLGNVISIISVHMNTSIINIHHDLTQAIITNLNQQQQQTVVSDPIHELIVTTGTADCGKKKRPVPCIDEHTEKIFSVFLHDINMFINQSKNEK